VTKQKQDFITVQGTVISVVKHDKEDYVSLTDLAKQKNPRDPKDVVKNWMRTRSTIRFLVFIRINTNNY
jgi:hypothetical protein